MLAVLLAVLLAPFAVFVVWCVLVLGRRLR